MIQDSMSGSYMWLIFRKDGTQGPAQLSLFPAVSYARVDENSKKCIYKVNKQTLQIYYDA